MIFEYYGESRNPLGMVEALDRDEAKRILVSRQVGYRKIKAVHSLKSDVFWSLLHGLSDLLNRGLTLHQSLLLAEQSTIVSVSRAAKRVQFLVCAGRTLRDALQSIFPGVSEYIFEMISIGEMSANLDRTLARIIATKQRQRESYEELREALIYPGLVFVTALVVCWILFDFIVPGFSGLVDQAVAESGITYWVFAVSGQIGPTIEYSIWSVVGCLGLGLIGARYSLIREPFERLILLVPAIGAIVKGRDRIKFLTVWSMGLLSGMAVEHALESATQAIHNGAIRNSLQGAVRQVRGGIPIDKALAMTGILKPDELFRLQLGLETGAMSSTVDQVASDATRHALHKLQLITRVVGPLAIILLGIAIGAIAYGILIPIFSLQNSIEIGA